MYPLGREAAPLARVIAGSGALILLLLVFGDFAVPTLDRGGNTGDETAAMAAIREIHTAQATYFSQFNRYAVSLKQLGPPQTGLPGAEAADLIGPDLASGRKGGYSVAMVGSEAGYSLSATPAANSTGNRTLYSDRSMAIHDTRGAPRCAHEYPGHIAAAFSCERCRSC
jgi:type IV pilus assembly protein PilA